MPMLLANIVMSLACSVLAPREPGAGLTTPIPC
jgi:hypothetical protein